MARMRHVRLWLEVFLQAALLRLSCFYKGPLCAGFCVSSAGLLKYVLYKFNQAMGAGLMDNQKTNLTRRTFVGGAAAVGVAAALPRVAFADPTAAEKQAEADAMLQKLLTLNEELDAKSKEYFQAVDAHDAAVEKMDECQTKIDENNTRIKELQNKLGNRANSMYRDGQTTFLDVILGSNSFDDFMKNWDMLTKLNENDARMVAETKELRADNETQRDEYSKQEKEAQEQVEASEKAIQEGNALAEQFQSSYDALSAEAQELYDKERQAALEAEAKAEQERIAAQESASSQTSSGTSGGSTGGSSTNNYIPPSGSVVDYAQSQIGVPYVYGGSTPNVGLDCSGLTSWCWQQATGIWIGRTDSAQYASARWRGSVSEAQPGDVLWTSGHVGICISAGGGTYIHAPQPGQTVCVSSWPQFSVALRW